MPEKAKREMGSWGFMRALRRPRHSGNSWANSGVLFAGFVRGFGTGVARRLAAGGEQLVYLVFQF